MQNACSVMLLDLGPGHDSTNHLLMAVRATAKCSFGLESARSLSNAACCVGNAASLTCKIVCCALMDIAGARTAPKQSIAELTLVLPDCGCFCGQSSNSLPLQWSFKVNCNHL